MRRPGGYGIRPYDQAHTSVGADSISARPTLGWRRVADCPYMGMTDTRAKEISPSDEISLTDKGKVHIILRM